MSVTMQEMINFHLTGKRSEEGEATGPGPDACPALLMPYRQLSELRYDFPLVLIDDPASPAIADSLTGIFNRLLQGIAPEGNAGEQLRQHVLGLEKRIRELVADGHEESLSTLWKRAERLLLADCEEVEAETLRNNLATARFALKSNGKALNCDARLPAQLLQHAFKKVEARRTLQSVEKIESLIIRLRNILKVDDLKNSSARTPQTLRKNLGKRYKESFDFDLMADLLDDATPRNRLPTLRRKRIKVALAVLESQRFFRAPNAEQRGPHQYQFIVDSLPAALKAYDERLPKIAEVVKAIAIAELECDNAYREEKHSSYFDRFGPPALAPEDLAEFPSYLICTHESECNVRDMASLTELVSSDLPMKVLLQVSDALTHQFAQSFAAPGNAFVLQSSASNLNRECKAIRKGLEFNGPAVFSVFAPLDRATSDIPPYLLAAAAMESRVFPAFSYDPVAGAGLADRFDISSNPRVSVDWPERTLSYEDEELQMIVEDCVFTAADFAITDGQYSDHFAYAPKESWSDDMLPVGEYLALANFDRFEKVPYVAAVDGDNVLRRFVVDDSLIRIVTRCRERWHALQEMGGVNNSYASAALAKVQAAPAVVPETVPKVEVAPVAKEVASEPPDVENEILEADQEAIDSDEPYIDTPRCTTCDECTNRNDRMFAYDENKQAYIKDPDAGTYRELVEAAEECQVAIIHPGKPRNPDEPGLKELIERAAPFMA